MILSSNSLLAPQGLDPKPVVFLVGFNSNTLTVQQWQVNHPTVYFLRCDDFG